MAKKITVYTLLIVVIIALLFANAYLINLRIWHVNVGKTTEKIDVSEFMTTVGASSEEFSDIKVPENAEYSTLWYGFVQAGEKVSFTVKSQDKDVVVEIFKVNGNDKCEYEKDVSFRNVFGEEQYDGVADEKFDGYFLYEDGVSVFIKYGGNSKEYWIIHGGNGEEVALSLVK